MPLTATVPEVFVGTMTTFLSDSYDELEETQNHMKNLKLKSYPGENVTDCCAAILVDAERLESAGSFKPEHLPEEYFIKYSSSEGTDIGAADSNGT